MAKPRQVQNLCVICHQDGADYTTVPVDTYQKRELMHTACYMKLSDDLNADYSGFEYLRDSMGEYELQRRIDKLASQRKYESKYPFDSATKSRDIELVFDLANDSPDPFEIMVMTQERDRILGLLTPAQQEIVVLTEEGYRPRDIAVIQGKLDKDGKVDSGSIRWQKWQSRQRAGGDKRD